MRFRIFDLANRSIRRKLIVLTVAISASSLLLFTVGATGFQYRNEYHQVVENHETLATVIAGSIAPAVAFQDRRTGEDTLKRLQSVAGGDVVRLVHSLKSASAMADAAALSRLAAKLERELSQGSAALRPEDAAAMQSLFKNYHQALSERGLVADTPLPEQGLRSIAEC